MNIYQKYLWNKAAVKQIDGQWYIVSTVNFSDNVEYKKYDNKEEA